MSFSTISTIKLIDKYRKNISTKAFNLNEPYKLDQAQKAIDYLNTLISKSPGSELQFQDYSEMSNYINYSEYLTKINELPTINATKKELTEHILKSRNIQRGIEIGNILTYKELQTTLYNWRAKAEQVIIPDEFVNIEIKNLKTFYNMADKQPPGVRNQIYLFLSKLANPQKLFNEAIKSNDVKISKLLSSIREKHSDKIQYIDHIYFFVSKADLQGEELDSIITLMSWFNRPLQQIYKFSAPDVDKKVKDIIAENHRKEQLAKLTEQQKQAEVKKQEEEQKKKEQEATQNKQEDHIDPLQEALDEMERTYGKFGQVSNIADELPRLDQQTSIDELNNFEKEYVDSAIQSNDQATRDVSSAISTLV